MIKTEKYNELIKEKMFKYRLQNGVSCYIIPKKGFADKQAMVIYDYGSIDTNFIYNKELIKTPNGIAHFLEHKMFENENGNAFLEFTKNTANVNAYTNYTSTAYYFNCIDKFYENLNLLFNMVTSPYFTNENVTKEKGIINEEIKMYEDNPFWKTYVNMQKGMYSKNPVRNEIAGNLEDIKSINKKLLDLCYDKFYNSGNLAVIVTGDIDEVKITESIEKHFKNHKSSNETTINFKENDSINSHFVNIDMNITMPMFHIGFRDYDFETNIDLKIATSKLATDILTGESSNWFQDLYNKNIIDFSFSRDYTCDKNSYGASIFSGYAKKPELVAENLLKQINHININGIEEDIFKRVKRKYLGRLIRSFNSIDTITMAQADLHTKEIDIFDLIEIYEKIEKQDVEKRIKEHFKEESMVISVANPLK